MAQVTYLYTTFIVSDVGAQLRLSAKKCAALLIVRRRMRLSVIVRYFYFLRAFIRPQEADAILVVNADAMLTCAVSPQHFQSISWRTCKIAQLDDMSQLIEFATRNAPQTDGAGSSSSL